MILDDGVPQVESWAWELTGWVDRGVGVFSWPEGQEYSRSRLGLDREGFVSVSSASLVVMTDDPRRVVEELCGPLAADPAADRAADRAVRVLHAQAAALAWVRQTAGAYPAPPAVSQRLAEVTTPQTYETLDRQLVMPGGDLDGRRWVGVIDVGHRVVVGPGPWQASHVYVVADEQARDEAGNLENLAVPASFA
jgi:hypothetical protein